MLKFEMQSIYSLISTILHLSLSSWETCALQIIDRYQPTSVFFFCTSSNKCASNNIYRLLRTPSQTIFGLEPHQLPNLKNTDLVFWFGLNVMKWNNDTILKYRLGGQNDFKILVVTDESDENAMEELFQTMWQSGIVYSALLLNSNNRSSLFTYIPFRSNKHCEDTRPVFLGECADNVESVFDMSNKIFNLNKCTIRISASSDKPYLEGKPLSGKLKPLLEEIGRRMNFSFEIMEPSEGRNGGVCGPQEFTGSKGDVFTGKAHMTVGSFSHDECSVLNYIGIPYMRCYSWCTPVMAENKYIYRFLIRLLQPNIWAALIVTMLMVIASVLVFSHVTNDQTIRKNLFNISLMIFAQVPLTIYRATSLRAIISLWLLECLVIRAVYESELKSRLSVPIGSHIIKDLDELSQSDLVLCSTTASLQMLVSSKDPSVKDLLGRTEICKGTMIENIRLASLNKDRAIFTNDLRCRASSSEINSSSIYPFTGNCRKTAQFITMVTLPGLPFNDYLQEIQNRCFESGLVIKWLDIRQTPHEKRQFSQFSMKNLLPVLFILVLGCFFAIVTFLGEILSCYVPSIVEI